MKIITELSGAATEGTAVATTGTLSQVLAEPVKGFFQSTKLSVEGVWLRCGEAQLLVPLEVLWKLGNAIEPKLVPVAPQQPVASEPAPI